MRNSAQQSKRLFPRSGSIVRMRFILTVAVAFLLTGRDAIAAMSAPALPAASDIGASSGQKRAQERVGAILRSEELRTGLCGVLAVRMNGDTLVNFASGHKLVPASTAKLISTGLALKVLGPDYRYGTTLKYSGTVRDSVLKGDLYIVGGGDPTTGAVFPGSRPVSELFAQWKQILLDAGISSIDGRIIADPRFFGDPAPENPGWSLEDLGFAYGAAPRGLNFYENSRSFYVASAASPLAPPVVTPKYPDYPQLDLGVSAICTKSATYDDLYCVNSEFAPYAEFRGAFPLGSRGYVIECSNRFGPLTCAEYFRRYLRSNGVPVSGDAAYLDARGYLHGSPGYADDGLRCASGLQTLGKTHSVPLSEIARVTNYRSDNFFAETLLRTLGGHLQHSCRYDSCCIAANRQLERMGLDVRGGCRLYDGSGLSRKNYISPSFFVSFLKAMTHTPVFESFYASLPSPGMEKTSLVNRFKDSPEALKARIRMKSGSMNGVRCFCGYIEASDGDPRHRVAFSVMTNNVTAPGTSVYRLIEGIILAIVEEN